MQQGTRHVEDQEVRPLLGGWIAGRFAPGHLDEYREWMKAKGRSRKQIYEVCTRARKMIRLCRFNTILDVDAETLELAVAEFLRDARDLAAKTLNDYLKSLQQLCRWMARPRIGRARVNPLSDVEHYSPSLPRHPRRSLSAQQVLTVIAHANAAGSYKRMSGADRAAYYLIKLHSGLRNTEAATLTPESFDLKSDPPAIIVEAAYSKHRRRDLQVILPELAQHLQEWLATKPAGERLFNLDGKPYLMWKMDLLACGIAYRDAAGFADLYSLRHTFATELGRSGASIKTVQQLMRHSDVRLTARYMKCSVLEEIRALGQLALPPRPCSAGVTSTFGADTRRKSGEVLSEAMQLAGVEPATFGSVDRHQPPAQNTPPHPETIRAVLAHLAAMNGAARAFPSE